MILGIGREALTFLGAVLSGMAAAAGSRSLAYLRQLVRHSALAEGAEDLLFWISTGFYLFCQIYKTTYGIIRWYFILGVVCGVSAWYFIIFLVKKICLMLKKSLEKRRKTL